MVKSIIYKKGDALKGPEKYLAHGCNNRGVMGSGIAKQIREKYEPAYDYYRFIYQRGKLKLGEIYPYDCGDKVIINCITQNGYGRDGALYADYDAIRKCFEAMNSMFGEKDLVAMPMIGSGLGGGSWPVIEIIIKETAKFQPVVYKL